MRRPAATSTPRTSKAEATRPPRCPPRTTCLPIFVIAESDCHLVSRRRQVNLFQDQGKAGGH
eukprot:5239537-Pyramimonas_sp.AAC.1